MSTFLAISIGIVALIVILGGGEPMDWLYSVSSNFARWLICRSPILFDFRRFKVLGMNSRFPIQFSNRGALETGTM